VNLILLDLCSLWGVVLHFMQTISFHSPIVALLPLPLPLTYLTFLCAGFVFAFCCRFLCCCHSNCRCGSLQILFRFPLSICLARLLLHFVASAGFWSLHRLASAFIIMIFFSTFFFCLIFLHIFGYCSCCCSCDPPKNASPNEPNTRALCPFAKCIGSKGKC